MRQGVKWLIPRLVYWSKSLLRAMRSALAGIFAPNLINDFLKQEKSYLTHKNLQI